MGLAMETGNIVQFPGPELTVIETERHLTKFQKKIQDGKHPVEIACENRANKKEVDRFKSVEEIDLFLNWLLERGRYRDALLMVLGCNTGLRISDILWLRWEDIYQTEDEFRDENYTVCQKTAKEQQVVFNEAVKQAAQLYRDNLDRIWRMDDWIFVSEGGRGCYVDMWDRLLKPKEEQQVQFNRQPMRVSSVSHLFTKAIKDSGLFGDRRISTHSFRKTGLDAITGGTIGVELDEQLKHQISMVKAAQQMAGHSSSTTTVNHYLTNDYRIAACIKMNLGLGAIKAYKRKEGIE